MKKKSELILYYLGISVALLLIAYVCAKGMTRFTLYLGIPTLAAALIGGKWERKLLRENPEIKKDKTCRVTKVLGYICAIIVVIKVWPRH